MSHIRLCCTRCGASHPPDMTTLACRDCGSPVDVGYVAPATEHADAGRAPLPMHDPGSAVSLGEGNTPIVELPSMGRLLGLERLYGKLEFLNPTGSFKDRGAAVMVSVAREHGVRELVEDSSGNAGASVAAYAARAGIKAHIFVPATAPAAKLRQIQAHGARVHAVKGSRENVKEAAVAFHHKRGIVYASHVMSPYFAEGTKTFAYELVEHRAHPLPDHIVFPVGNGSLLIGTWKGLVELREAGRLAQMPRLHCVQARGVAPVVAAHGGEPWAPERNGGTVAGGVAVAAPARLDQIVQVLRDSNGAAVAVDDASILATQRDLSELEGVFSEPTSAAAFAGIRSLVERGVVRDGDTVLAPVTGSGLKGGE